MRDKLDKYVEVLRGLLPIQSRLKFALDADLFRRSLAAGGRSGKISILRQPPRYTSTLLLDRTLIARFDQMKKRGK